MRFGAPWLLAVVACGAFGASLPAQSAAFPATRVIPYKEVGVPGRVDSGVPMTWTRIDGRPTLVAFASWGGIPERMAGPDLGADGIRRSPEQKRGLFLTGRSNHYEFTGKS